MLMSVCNGNAGVNVCTSIADLCLFICFPFVDLLDGFDPVRAITSVCQLACWLLSIFVSLSIDSLSVVVEIEID